MTDFRRGRILDDSTKYVYLAIGRRIPARMRRYVLLMAAETSTNHRRRASFSISSEPPLRWMTGRDGAVSSELRLARYAISADDELTPRRYYIRSSSESYSADGILGQPPIRYTVIPPVNYPLGGATFTFSGGATDHY